MSPALSELFHVLDGYSNRVPLADLVRHVREHAIDIEDVRDFLAFGRESYQRNLLRAGSAYHALILCWRNGQRSPIHDHRGSSCAVRVLRGIATETQFAKNQKGLVYATHSRELPEGSVCGSQDDDTHQMSNLQAGDAELVTLHIYSPPLLVMGKYSLTEPLVSEFVDPIVEFALGGGI